MAKLSFSFAISTIIDNLTSEKSNYERRISYEQKNTDYDVHPINQL
jgi:hypothetical protein